MNKNYAQYLLKKGIENYNLIAEEFSSKRQELWPEMKFLFNDYLAAGDKVLDLGCGNGRFFELLKDKNVDYLGVDSSEKLIRIAGTKYPQAKFQVADALSLPFPNDQFDKIYSIAVLHHIPSKELRSRFLEEAKRVLKLGGLLVLTVWKPKDRQERFLKAKFLFKKAFGSAGGLDVGDVIEPWFGDNKGERYLHCFSEKELANLAKQAGFEVKKSGLIKNEKGNRQNIYLIVQK
ncbi:MAG: class I SAM-dependent methyltransferase [Patescibacteria group bacterium]